MKNNLCCLTIVLLIGLINATYAQDPTQSIPTDPKVRIGQLDNGLTYYIRRNELPENRADFYIAQKVGSIQEQKDQKGLAHFLEHMAFNGTTHFPGDDNGLGVIEWCETIGIKFGVNINAYTSIDETVYNISNIPTIREGILDSCLLILHDWANDLILDEKEIDKERGVIEEEWRTRMSPQQRFMERALSEMYKGTRYADCLPIGNMEIVRNFKYQTLRDYYEKWYRPDLQGIMIVGDIDVDAMEKRIEKLFSDIPAQPNAEERIYYPVTDNKEPIIIIEKDKEQTNVQALLFNKHDQSPKELKNTTSYMLELYIEQMIGSMLNSRLSELSQSPNPPFIYGYTYVSDYFVSKTKGAFTGVAVCKEEDITLGIKTLLTEIERARRFGFTDTEYARALVNYTTQLESALKERDKVQNSTYIQLYVRHFLDNEPIPGIIKAHSIMSELTPKVTVEQINEQLKKLITENNRVLALNMPDKDGLQPPSIDELLAILNSTQSEELTPYIDKVSNKPLISEEPIGGKIISEDSTWLFGSTKLTLSNGVEVIIKSTDFTADQIIMRGVSFGGSSLYPTSDIINISFLNPVSGLGGIGDFNLIELSKRLAGKRASSNTNIGDQAETISGSSSPRDFKTMMQLTYLNFTSPRRDIEAFESYKVKAKASLKSQSLNPKVTFNDSIATILYNNNPRIISLKEEMVDQIDYDRVLEIHKDRFSDASDFTFILVGNIDMDSVKPYIERYLGSLPSTNRKETFRDNNVYPRDGIIKSEFIKAQDTPKASVFITYNGDCKYTLKSRVMMSITTQVLNMIYTEKVREEVGGTYGVNVSGGVGKYPKERYVLNISFDTDPNKKSSLMDIIFAEIEKITKEDISESEVSKVKEYMIKSHAEQVKTNSYWLGQINEYLTTGVNMSGEYIDTVNSITLKDIRKFVHTLLKQKNRVEVTMTTGVEAE